MLIRCIKCKSEFEQQRGERTCGCRPSERSEYKAKARKKYKQNHRPFFNYIGSIRRHFLNVIYQYKKRYEWECNCTLSLNKDEASHDYQICECECHYS